MREILFRGKRIDNGEWVYSRSILTVLQDNKYLHFIPQQGEDFKAEPNEKNGRILTITKGNYNQVDYETIGQYTGLKDKNGNEIFEGDIVEFISVDLSNPRIVATINYGEYENQPLCESCNYSDIQLGYYMQTARGQGSILLGSKHEGKMIKNS